MADTGRDCPNDIADRSVVDRTRCRRPCRVPRAPRPRRRLRLIALHTPLTDCSCVPAQSASPVREPRKSVLAVAAGRRCKTSCLTDGKRRCLVEPRARLRSGTHTGRRRRVQVATRHRRPEKYVVAPPPSCAAHAASRVGGIAPGESLLGEQLLLLLLDRLEVRAQVRRERLDLSRDVGRQLRRRCGDGSGVTSLG